jgi:hypothetical protein
MIDVLAAPVVASLLTMVAYLVLVQTIDLNSIYLPLLVALKAVFASGVFFVIMLALRPRELVERTGYVWRLLRGAA